MKSYRPSVCHDVAETKQTKSYEYIKKKSVHASVCNDVFCTPEPKQISLTREKLTNFPLNCWRRKTRWQIDVWRAVQGRRAGCGRNARRWVQFVATLYATTLSPETRLAMLRDCTCPPPSYPCTCGMYSTWLCQQSVHLWCDTVLVN